MTSSLVGSEMCIRDSLYSWLKADPDTPQLASQFTTLHGVCHTPLEVMNHRIEQWKTLWHRDKEEQ
eukprot:11814264-Prorocentrum_lima.AAC.1